ncbi:MAG: BatA domain-containing protein, partial [Aureliella sp.]
MGLLAPLYALAALALAGPILFHLIRRQPRGEVTFSSLMFLSPSPPRLTRRSRLDNLWLLLLRVLALLLISVAFMRPFLRQDQFLNATLAGRHIVLLIDTSGSMQRGDIWTAAQRIATEVLSELSPTDQVALYSIDSELTAILPLDELDKSAPSVTQQAAKEALAKLEPTWLPTELAEGLKSLVDSIASQGISDALPVGTNHEVVLVTDLHSGIRLEGLQGFAWPENLHLDIRQVL